MPGLLYIVAIIAATAVGGRIGGLVAVAASAYPFFHYFAARYDRDQSERRGHHRPRNVRPRRGVRE